MRPFCLLEGCGRSVVEDQIQKNDTVDLTGLLQSLPSLAPNSEQDSLLGLDLWHSGWPRKKKRVSFLMRPIRNSAARNFGFGQLALWVGSRP